MPALRVGAGMVAHKGYPRRHSGGWAFRTCGCRFSSVSRHGPQEMNEADRGVCQNDVWPLGLCVLGRLLSLRRAAALWLRISDDAHGSSIMHTVELSRMEGSGYGHGRIRCAVWIFDATHVMPAAAPPVATLILQNCCRRLSTCVMTSAGQLFKRCVATMTRTCH